MIALLPLDDRPCNLQFPAQIAAIGADEICAPAPELLGHFNAPGDCAALQIWLDQLPEVSALIVSIDMLAYGGLVASRKTTTDVSTALSRLQTLKNWRAQRPEVPVYAFNILMRLAITMDSDAAVPHYYNVMRWARLMDEAARFPTPEKQSELAEVRALLPDDLVEQYRAARARNHAVNLQMVDWLADGTFDFLLVTQEDCTEFGLHRAERNEILARVREREVEAKFALHPGADEAALTLLARSWKTEVFFQIHWSSETGKRNIAVFEDVPYQDALNSHITAMGGRVAGGNADVELWVNAPVTGSQKDEAEADKRARGAQLEAFVSGLKNAVQSGARVALCDVAFPNGADNLLMEKLEASEVLGQLAAYGGWNTAGNTTGTVLAQCAALVRGGEAELNRQFLFERLLDDWFYQANLRAALEHEARQRGFSPLNMNGRGPEIEALAREKMAQFARDLARDQFGARVRDLKVALPWSRTFEVEVGAKLVGISLRPSVG